MRTLAFSKGGKPRGYRGVKMMGQSRVRWELEEVRDRMELAFWAGVERGGGVYWPELGPLNSMERDVVRATVAERVTYDLARPEVFIHAKM
jgi:hypothetical protein